MKLRIYLESSVIGGYYDIGYKAVTRQLFERIACKEFEVYFSELTDAELMSAPRQVKMVKKIIPPACFHYIKMNEDIWDLASLYIKEKAISESCRIDAYHIAFASASGIDCLISWNFKQIVNYDKIKIFKEINMRFGYPVIDFRSPLEFIKI